MSIKIRKSDIVIFLLLFPLYRPPYLAIKSFSILDSYFIYGKILSFTVVLFCWVYRCLKGFNNFKIRNTINITLYLCFFLCLFISSVLANNMAEIGSAFLPVITIILLFLYYVDSDVTRFLAPLSFLLSIYATINLFTVIVFPDGLYSTKAYEYGTNELASWFLGYKNPQIRILLPAICISSILDIIKYKRLKPKSILLLVMVVVNVILIKSATALIGVFVFVGIYFLRYKWNIHIKPIWFVGFNVLFFVFVVLLRFQNIFSFFIVNMLHKDITFSGRTTIWNQALLMVLAHPILGIGAASFPIGPYYVATHPHNLILYILIKSGILGLCFFSSSLFICVKELDQTQQYKISQILIMEFCSFFTMTMLESMTEGIFFWLMIIMGICMKSMCRYEVQEKPVLRHQRTGIM